VLPHDQVTTGSRTPVTRPGEWHLAPSTVERMRAASDGRDATLISVLAYAGLRPGEALALRWRHVGEQRLVVDAPKTGARRSVTLLQPLREDLELWREGSLVSELDATVFPNERGAAMSEEAYKSWSRRGFARAAEAAGAPDATPYALRHSFCSLLLAEGRSVIEGCATDGPRCASDPRHLRPCDRRAGRSGPCQR